MKLVVRELIVFARVFDNQNLYCEVLQILLSFFSYRHSASLVFRRS